MIGICSDKGLGLNSIYYFIFFIIKIILLLKLKVVYLRPFSSTLSFLKFWKQTFMYSGYEHVESGPNCFQRWQDLYNCSFYIKVIIVNNSKVTYKRYIVLREQ